MPILTEARALARYALRIALFAMPIVGIIAGLELGVSHVGTLHKSRARRLEQAESQPVLVITGNSHEAVGISCRELGQPCFKFAAGSQSLLLDQQLLRRYESRLPGVRVLIIGVSYFSFQYALSVSGESWRQFEYYHAYGLDGERGSLPFLDIRKHSAFATYGPGSAIEWALLGFPRELPAARAETAGDVNVSALVRREKDHKTLRRRLAQHDARLRPELIPETSAAVSAMIEWAHSRQAVPLLVVSPVARAYAEACNARELAAMRTALGKLRLRHGTAVGDYMSDPRFDDADFYDFDHLTHDGSRKFTNILRDEMVEPALRALKPPASQTGTTSQAETMRSTTAE